MNPCNINDNVLAPRYYDPEVDAVLDYLGETHDLVSIQKLLDDDVLEISTGHEVGKLAYGSGTVPFVRTSDISNWEVKLDPKHCVSDEVYDTLAAKQDVRAGDILMVVSGVQGALRVVSYREVEGRCGKAQPASMLMRARDSLPMPAIAGA